MKGCYLLLIELPMDIEIKKWNLKKGTYVYVGSAMNNLEKRVSRHLSKSKKLHWHIDYLLDKSSVKSVIMVSSNTKCEEKISLYMSQFFTGPKGFGSSDLKVQTNLYYIDNFDKFSKIVSNILKGELK
ncbi:Uri superfamily endonuclease [Thermosipho japonicus]|uniref:Uri superfamily endonuclease n=1 Tax=Thermosipho japonicus TaxID=90323 RepID=A0A841GN02_9BACT|nr:GIY-YIG nuclease family protein [Thermosipho japonicus]MBB6063365.1 Uri superfamily endonuclease [Thermosipho japonicus]